MSGLGGLNQSPNGVVIGLVQLQLPVTETKRISRNRRRRYAEMVEKGKQFAAPIDLVVFPEYMLHGLSMVWTRRSCGRYCVCAVVLRLDLRFAMTVCSRKSAVNSHTKAAGVILRTAGYTAPIRHSWRITSQSNAFCNLAYTASVAMCSTDGTNDSMGEGMIVNFDGVPMVEGSNEPDEIITESDPTSSAKRGRTDQIENNIYQQYTMVMSPLKGNK